MSAGMLFELLRELRKGSFEIWCAKVSKTGVSVMLRSVSTPDTLCSGADVGLVVVDLVPG